MPLSTLLDQTCQPRGRVGRGDHRLLRRVDFPLQSWSVTAVHKNGDRGKQRHSCLPLIASRRADSNMMLALPLTQGRLGLDGTDSRWQWHKLPCHQIAKPTFVRQRSAPKQLGQHGQRLISEVLIDERLLFSYRFGQRCMMADRAPSLFWRRCRDTAPRSTIVPGIGNRSTAASKVAFCFADDLVRRRDS